MGKSKESIVGVLIMLTLLFSFQIFYSGLWISSCGMICTHSIGPQLQTLGLSLMLVSAIGLLGAFRRSSRLLFIYIHFKFVLILLLLIFTLFAFYVTRKDLVVSNTKHQLGRGYFDFLRKRVEIERDWESIKTCLQAKKVCDTDYVSSCVGKFQKEHIQSACCKPCNFSETAPNTDCELWDNHPNVMCFNCQSCKSGLMDTMRSDLEKVVTVSIVYLVCLIIVYSAIFCVLGNDSHDDYLMRYRTYLKHSWSYLKQKTT